MMKYWKARKRIKSMKSLCFDIPLKNLSRTFEIENDAIHDWIEVQNHWVDLYFSLNDCYEENILTSNIVFRQFFILSRNLRWHTTAVMSGAYESAARDLRYILEDMCQALYLEQTYPELTSKQIYEKMKEKRPPRGKTLIDVLNIPKTIKKDMSDIMGKLHTYVHPSYEQIMENIEDIKMVLFHKHDWFVNLRELHRKVADVALYIVLNSFPDARAHFLNKPFVESSLQHMDFKHTLDIDE